MAARFRLAAEINGVLSVLAEPAGQLDSAELGRDTSGETTSRFGWRGGATYSDVLTLATAFNRAVSDRYRPESEAFEDPWTARNVRYLIGFKHDAARDTSWWYSEVLGGYAGPSAEHFDIGQINATKAYFDLEVKHRAWWFRDTVQNVVTNAAINNLHTGGGGYNVRAYDYTPIGSLGNLSPIIRLSVTHGHAIALRRLVIGMGRNSSAINTKIGAWPSVACNPPYTTPVQLTLSPTTVNVNNYPSGMARVLISLYGSALAHSNFQYSVDGGKHWASPMEAGSNLVVGPILRLPATRVNGLAGTNTSLTLHVRNIGSLPLTFPAGEAHLYPCDQWAQFECHTKVANTQVLIDDGRFDQRYIKTGVSSAVYDCITRFGAPLSAPPDWGAIAFFGEGEDGRTDTFAAQLTIDAWARRRGI